MRKIAGGLVLVSAMVSGAVLLACTSVPIVAAEPTRVTSALAASPEDAVRSTVEAAGDRYAGDCAGTVSPRDAGKVCSRLATERDGVRAYMTGRTFSEFSRWVFVAPSGGAWTVAGMAPLDFFGPADPPWPERTQTVAWGDAAEAAGD